MYREKSTCQVRLLVRSSYPCQFHFETREHKLGQWCWNYCTGRDDDRVNVGCSIFYWYPQWWWWTAYARMCMLAFLIGDNGPSVITRNQFANYGRKQEFENRFQLATSIRCQGTWVKQYMYDPFYDPPNLLRQHHRYVIITWLGCCDPSSRVIKSGCTVQLLLVTRIELNLQIYSPCAVHYRLFSSTG